MAGVTVTPQTLDYRAAAAYVGIGKTLFFERVKPHVKSVRIGGAVRYRKQDLDRYLDALAQ